MEQEVEICHVDSRKWRDGIGTSVKDDLVQLRTCHNFSCESLNVAV
jgi:hypothetical protein